MLASAPTRFTAMPYKRIGRVGNAEEIIACSWESRSAKLLRYCIEALLGMLIILAVISFWWPRRPASPSIRTPSLTPTPARQSADGMAVLVSAHLFGQAPQTSHIAAASATPITVDGIVYSSDAGRSQAILTMNGKTNLYKVGDTLADGERITAIDTTDVELSEQGAARRQLAMQSYGSPSSAGPAAYADLLQGAGLGPGAANPDPGAVANTVQSRQLYTPAFHPLVMARTVHMDAHATPIEQLRSLRSQLIR